MKTGIEIISDERQRQIEVEGLTPEKEDLYTAGHLALAGATYAIPTFSRKPTPDDRIRELAKAGAFIAAEIDRLQRLK